MHQPPPQEDGPRRVIQSTTEPPAVTPNAMPRAAPVEYAREYFAQRHDLAAFERRTNEQMEAYEQVEKEKRERLLARSTAPDEDGFTTVFSGKVRPFASKDNDADNEEGGGAGHQGASSRDANLPKKRVENFYKVAGAASAIKAQRTALSSCSTLCMQSLPSLHAPSTNSLASLPGSHRTCRSAGIL